MAYVTCRDCGFLAFSTAYWSNVDYCGRCGSELPHPQRSVKARRFTSDLAGTTSPAAGSSSGLSDAEGPGPGV